VTIRNISKHPVGLGIGGLFNPSIFLSVSAEGPARATLPNLTLITLPSPKYLEAGKEVSQTIRVDVGELDDLLASWPMAEVKLSISALLDPLQDGEKLFSSVPGIKIAPVTIRRAALFDVSGLEKSARFALGYIVRDLQQGSPAQQMRAVRQTASLLGYVCRSETGKAKPILPKVITRPILLSMTRAFLESPSPVVRSEMLAALHHVDLNAQIISLMGPRIQDTDSMVRMRLIELLAVKRTRGHRTLLDLFAVDSDELVREMAKALRKK
ncbi:MAG: HEAT repeat domain-containing protein, partial [Phycisphaerae bacterium]|nr:HEAT repeat domain-containing protein [Phycisphaerae bacterium]